MGSEFSSCLIASAALDHGITKVLSEVLSSRFANENAVDELVIVDDEESGIKNLVIDCEPPILVLEQLSLRP